VTNLQELTEAGIIDPRDLTEKQKEVIDKFSPQEVVALISIKAKLRKARIRKLDLKGYFFGGCDDTQA